MAALVLASGTARGEEKADPLPGFGMGIGLGLGTTYTGGTPATSPVSIAATFHVSDSVRIEPDFGLWYDSKGATTTAPLPDSWASCDATSTLIVEPSPDGLSTSPPAPGSRSAP
jgi:hypothetical protein